MHGRDLKALFVVLSVVFLASRIGYAQDPPSHLTTDGYFDDHIHLHWWAPGVTGSELTVSHYEGPMVNAHAHYNGGDAWAITVDPNAIGSYELWAISIYILSEGDPYWPWPNSIHEPIIVKAWADNGSGQPGAEIYSMQDQLVYTGSSWLVHDVTGVTATGTIFVGNQQISAYPNCEGMGVDAALTYPQFMWYRIGGTWIQATDLAGDLMFEALVFGDFGAGPEARWVGPNGSRPANSTPPDFGLGESKQEVSNVATLHEGSLPPFWNEFHPFRAPSYSGIERTFPGSDGTDALSDYNIYRGGAYYASTVGVIEDYDDYGIVEGTAYEYTVTAFYVPEGESIPTDPASGTANMPPGAPTNLVATSNLIDTMTLTWDDPTVNEDGTPCVDLAGLKVYRDGLFLAQVNPGVATYDDVVPNPMALYTWSVTGIDEVPNEGPAAQVSGAVISPWQQIPYQWVEISGIGTNTGITMDDQNVGPFPFGFNFQFYGNTFNSIRVCSNGFLSFTSTAANWSNQPIPTTAEPNNLIALFWDDFNPSTGGTIWYYQDAANQRFIVQYDHVRYYSGSGDITVQVIFNADGSMIYAYNSITGVNNSCTVGIENATGTEGEQLCYNGTGAFIPTSGTAVGWWMTIGPPPDVSIDLVAVGSTSFPYSTGGTLTFNATLTNNDPDNPVSGVAWTYYGTRVLLGPVPVNLGAGASQTYNNIPQVVPGNRLPVGGPYQYYGAFGASTSVPWATDFIDFYIEPGDGDGIPIATDWVTSSDFGGSSSYNLTPTPSEFALEGNHPNPFNPTTTISFTLKDAGLVKLTVFDVTGREVARLVNGYRDAGQHQVSFDASNLASGIYVYRLNAGDFNATGKMVLMK